MKDSIYIVYDKDEDVIICSGISFREFFEKLQTDLHNLVIIQGDYCGNNYIRNFEVIEGQEALRHFVLEQLKPYGNFCVADYPSTEKIMSLDDTEICEMLYLAHMHHPYNRTFWDGLSNQFVYISHDDSWYCKWYCQKATKLYDAVAGIILERAGCEKTAADKAKLSSFISKWLEEGLLCKISRKRKTITNQSLLFYIVGKYTDMDKLWNECKGNKVGMMKEIKLN